MSDPVSLGIFANRLAAIAEEMGAVLQRAALSPNIRDRLDFSCALFDARGGLLAQAAHIPVHLGSMAFAMESLVESRDWSEGDLLVWNDPFAGGTHLPDITMAAPVFVDGKRMGFVANRAHHADIGSAAPGSMPLSSSLEEEGILISPTLLGRDGQLLGDKFDRLTRDLGDHSRGDFIAQWSSCRRGVERLADALRQMGLESFEQNRHELNRYATTLARQIFAGVPGGTWEATELMDSDGFGAFDIPLKLTLTTSPQGWQADFTGTSPQVQGNLNCPLSVTMASLFYVFRCLMPAETPVCAGLFEGLELKAPEGCLVNARYPAAVAAGNVETSQRIVDLVLQALRQAGLKQLPADSQGTMNNLAMGGTREDGSRWSYYETIGGGCGANPRGHGLDACQSHMTNTLNTPVESLESNFPVRLLSYQIRSGSAGLGRWNGGCGLVREYLFESSARVNLISERRRHAPKGISGGGDGKPGTNWLDGVPLPEKVDLQINEGQVLRIETPGGGGWGSLVSE